LATLKNDFGESDLPPACHAEEGDGGGCRAGTGHPLAITLSAF